jgi:two-component system, NarL family, response regulator
VKASHAVDDPIRVMVVEDNFYTRHGTLAFLREQPGIDVVGDAPDGERALTMHPRLRPDVTVVDLHLPGMDGTKLIATICATANEPRLLVLTQYVGEEDIYQALKAGARGYLTKESSGDDLLTAIRALHAGRRFLPPAILESIANRESRPELTRRERHVLGRVADGASNREVGSDLGITERTVGLYMSRILSKLDARSRTEAVSTAQRLGLLRERQP